MATGRGRRRPKGELKVADWGWDDDKKGPWFIARYPSTLSCCGDECEEGDEIRADSEGGYEGRCCYSEEDDD